VRVVDVRGERRLLVAGDTLSVLPLDGDWSRLGGEYWWQALALAPLPARPRALFVGLGGGTTLHLLVRRARPRALVVIERDPVILRAALACFGLDQVNGVEYLCGEALSVARWLARSRRRFDFVFEDALYAERLEHALPLARTLAALVAPGGTLVVNRHRRGDARRLAAALRPDFGRVRLHRVRREAENVLVTASHPRRAPRSIRTR
jgi:spermidine synthase